MTISLTRSATEITIPNTAVQYAATLTSSKRIDETRSLAVDILKEQPSSNRWSSVSAHRFVVKKSSAEEKSKNVVLILSGRFTLGVKMFNAVVVLNGMRGE